MSGLYIGVILTIVAIFVGLITGFFAAIPTYFLWNALVPSLFGLSKVSFLQAWGLCWLTAILFKGSSTCTCKKE